MSAITNWVRRFDPDGADLSVFEKTETELIKRFLADAGFSLQDGMKHARTMRVPVLGDCWAFPTTTIFLDPPADPVKN
jgi:hypothetical protein